MPQPTMNEAAVNDSQIIILLIGNSNETESIRKKINNNHRTILSAGTEDQALDFILKEQVGIAIIFDQQNITSDFIGKLQSKQIITIVSDNTAEFDKELTANTNLYYKCLNINSVCESFDFFEQIYFQKLELNLLKSKCAESTRQLDEFVYIVSHDLKAP